MLVKENINFERGQDPKEAMNIGNREERLRKKHIIEAKKQIEAPIEKGLFHTDYILTKESSQEEIDRFLKDCRNLKKQLSNGVIPLLIKGLKYGYVTVIQCQKPKYGNSSIPTNYFYWQTIQDGIYDPVDIFLMADDIKNYIKKQIKMGIVKEDLNFERGRDPKFSMGVGKKSQILKDLEKEDIDEKDVQINPDFTLSWIGQGRKPMSFVMLQIKYLDEKKRNFVQKLYHAKINDKPIETAIQESVDNGIDPKDCLDLIEEFNDFLTLDKINIEKAKLYLRKISRDQEQIEYDEEYNTYAFIGFTDKVPVKIDGETYYKDKFSTESIIKIDKYKYEDLIQIHPMKIRAGYQYKDGKVYLLDIPKFIMDEDRYEEVPFHAYDILVKYKRRA